MIVNLFDNTFRGSKCSTAYALSKYIEYVRDLESFDGVTLFVDGFAIWDTPNKVKSPIKLAWLHEPPSLIPSVYSETKVLGARFDRVITYHPDLLAELPNAVYGIYGGCWIPKADWGLRSKTKLCTMLVGNKIATSGHQLRRATAEFLKNRGDSVEFFGSIGTPTDYSIKTKMLVNADAAFTVITETESIDGLFTDWLLDAFAVGTIPIYWGCPNLPKYFNPAGVLAFETAEQCAEIVRGLSMGLYNSMLPAIAENMHLAEQYAVAEDWMYEHILKEYD